ncbi:MAG: tRNA guanosine(34) transglycosylase Tgt, partial [Actinomycetota bacterium]
ADIAMVLDVPVNLPVDRAIAERSMYQTLRWAERSKTAKTRADRALFGIVQGGSDPELRAISARETAAIGFPGFGIGGLAVGETASERAIAIAATVPELPESAVRYVMGLGDTEGILDAVALGVDLFDCVLPTRLARHGKALSRDGDFSIRRVEWAVDDGPIEHDCDCVTCRRYSRAYLRHLRLTKERTADRLLTIHNLAYTYRLMSDIRSAIETGRFDAFHAEVVARRR